MGCTPSSGKKTSINALPLSSNQDPIPVTTTRMQLAAAPSAKKKSKGSDADPAAEANIEEATIGIPTASRGNIFDAIIVVSPNFSQSVAQPKPVEPVAEASTTSAVKPPRHNEVYFTAGKPVEAPTPHGIHSFLIDGTLNAKTDPAFVAALEESSKGAKAFTDPFFPPNATSIGSNDVQLWARSKDFSGEAPVLMNVPGPDDIYQGVLGDCYFLSSLAVLAEHPELIKFLFDCPGIGSHSSKDLASLGCYQFKICVGGEWVAVPVDDWFPCQRNASGKPELMFSRCSKSNELWVAVAEKAWAKLGTNYRSIEGGLNDMALQCLTGSPAKYYRLNDMSEADLNELWNTMFNCQDVNVISCATSSDPKICVNTGLSAGHAYAVLKLATVNKERLIKVRNPWGCSEWKGKWSDGSNAWTPAAKKQLEYVNSDDGAFWMSWKDHLKYFDEATICFVHAGWFHSASPGKAGSPGLGLGLEIDISENVEAFISIQQAEVRFRAPSASHDLIDLGFEKEPGAMSAVLVTSVPINALESNWIKLSLTPGTYVIVPNVGYLKSGVTASYMFTTYSDKQISPKAIEESKQNKYIFEAYLNSVTSSGKATSLSGAFPREVEAKLMAIYQHAIGSTHFYLYENKSATKGLQIKATFELNNFALMRCDESNDFLLSIPDSILPKTKTTSTVVLKIQPNSSQLLFLRRSASSGAAGLAVSYLPSLY